MINLYLEMFVCFFQIVLFQFIAIPRFRKDTYSLGLTRNLNWVRENPSFLLKFPIRKDKYHYFFGSILISLIFLQVAFKAEYNYIWIIHIISAVGMTAQYFVVDFRLYLKMRKEIPREVRVASLVPRKLSRFLPKKVIIIFLFLLLSCYNLWGQYLYSLDQLAIKNIFSLFWDIFGLIILFFMLHYTVQKAPICNDFEVDDQYRKLEITVISVIMFLDVISHLLSLICKMYFKDADFLGVGGLGPLLPLMAFAIFMFLSKKILKNIPRFENEPIA